MSYIAAMKYLVVIAALLIAGPALAAKQHAEPPARYSGGFKGKLIVKSVPKGDAFRVCTNLGYAYNGEAPSDFYPGMLGCAFGGVGTDTPKTCTIVFTAGKQHVKRHEIAHCAGWPSDHPQ